MDIISADEFENSDLWMAEVNLTSVTEASEGCVSACHSTDFTKETGVLQRVRGFPTSSGKHMQHRLKEALNKTKSNQASKTLMTSSPVNVTSEISYSKGDLDLSSQCDLFEDSALGQTDWSADSHGMLGQTSPGRENEHFPLSDHVITIMCTDTLNATSKESPCNLPHTDTFNTGAVKSAKSAASLTSLKNRIKNRLLMNTTTEGADQNTLQELRNENISKAQVEASQIRRMISSQDVGPFYGLPSKVQELLVTNRKITKLYDWQECCLQLPAVYRGSNLIYTLPTSGGKTLVAEILILRQLLCRKKNALLILPYVSIVQEKVRILSEFATELGFLVEEYAGSKGRFPPIKRRVKHSLYISTIEKGQSLINCLLETGRSNELGLIVVDELHMIGEGGSRGATMESTLLKLLCGTNDPPQIIGMSATLNNIADLCKFLKAEVFYSDFRPVSLTEYVKVEENLYRVESTALAPDEILQHDRFLVFNRMSDVKELDPDHLLGLALEIVPDKSCLLFCPTKKNCENVAHMLAKLMHKQHQSLANIHREKRKALLQELKIDGGGKMCPILRCTIPYGLAYHHSGLTTDERRLIEDAYSDGVLCLLTCTSTLAAGVNLPAKRVILRSPFVGADFLKHSQYKQMTGRAGRAGIDSSGESILIAKTGDMPKVLEMLTGPQDVCHSSLMCDGGKGLRSLILSLVGLKIVNTTEGIFRAMSQTLLAIQAATLGIDVTQATRDAVQNLLDEGLVIQKKAGLCTTSQMSKATENIVKTTSSSQTDAPSSFLDGVSQCPERDAYNSTAESLKENIYCQNLVEDRKVHSEKLPLEVGEPDQARPKRQRLLEVQHAGSENPVDTSGSSCGESQNRMDARKSQTCVEDPVKDRHSDKRTETIPGHISLSDLVLEVTGLGKATFKGSVDLECGSRLYQDLKKGEQSLVLVNYLHLLYLVTPYDLARDVSPPWMTYLDQFSRLSSDEVKVANLIGVPESYLVKRATAQTSRQKIDILTVQRFFLTLMLYDLWRQLSIWDVAERFQQTRGFVQNLLSSTASFASCVFRFCQELPEFWPYQELLGNFVRNLAYCVTMELIPLMEIPGVKLGRAKQIYNAGYQTQQALASADPAELAARVEFLTHKAARQLVSAAKVLLEEKAEALLEQVQELVPLPPPSQESTSEEMRNTL